MKIKSVRARVYEWKGKTVPPQGNFCSNAMDLVYSNTESMSTFRFHSWTVVEIETDDGIIGLGNVALAPRIAKAIIDHEIEDASDDYRMEEAPLFEMLTDVGFRSVEIVDRVERDIVLVGRKNA